MPLCFAGLMCHAPIVVPAVGGREAERCRATTRAMRESRIKHDRDPPLIF